jgi:hypothetical protein
MRIALFAAIGILLCSASAFADDNQGGAMGQLQNATSGNQTLSQTYGDTSKPEKCPEACPSGNTNVPEPPPPQPADDQKSGG